MRLARAGREAVNLATIAIFVIVASRWALEVSRPSLVFAFGVNWGLMGFASFLWRVAPMHFGRGYYEVHAWERDGRLYERLGARAFQRFLRITGLAWLRLEGRGTGARARLLEATKGPESAHLLVFCILCGIAMHCAMRGWWDTAAWLTLFNVLHNLYPVISLRYVRARIGSRPAPGPPDLSR